MGITHDKALATLREIANDVCLNLADKVDREGHWPEEGLRAIQEAGLGGLTVPRQFGGLGMGMSGLARACEILGSICPSTGLCFGMHAVGAAVIAAKPTDHQISTYLEPIVEGSHLTTLALSEPGTGSHFYYPQTRMKVEADGFTVSGEKSFVTNGGHADSYVISVAGAGPDESAGAFSCLVIDGSLPGLEWGGPWLGMGMRGNSSRTLHLNDVEVATESLLGSEGDEIWYIFNVVAPFFLIAMSGVYLGIGQAAIERVTDHLKARRFAHTGGGPAQSQVAQWQLGRIWASVERTRSLIYAAAAAGDEGKADALPMILSSKSEIADAAVGAVNDAMSLMGGIAYSERSAMERLLRDVRAAHVMAPTTDLLRIWTGRWLLEIPLLAD